MSNSGFGSEKDESTSWKEFYQYTKLNKLYTLEVNYWGKQIENKKLKEEKLMKNNLRIVKNFDDFYQIRDFKKIGHSLMKSLISFYRINRDKEQKKLMDDKMDKFYSSYKSKVQKKKKK